LVSFHPVRGDALTTIRCQRRTWNVWEQEVARQVTAGFPVTQTLPDPVTLIFSATVEEIFAPEALAAISSPTGTAALTASTPSRSRYRRRTPR
jgi:hypothetical protein